MNFLRLIGLLIVASSCQSKPMYKCEANGAVSYQFKPCEPDQIGGVVGESEQDQPKRANFPNLDYSITVGELSVEFDHPGYDGNVWFVYKFRVSNNMAVPIEKFFTYQAVNFEGFELCEFNTLAKVKQNSTQIITGSYYMPAEKWRKVYKWQRVD